MKKRVLNLNYIFVIYQCFAIVASVINLICNFITGKEDIFFASYVSWFVPQFYILKTGNLFNFIPLLLFVGVTLFILIKSMRFSSAPNIKNAKYLNLNVLWLGISQLSYMMFFCYHLDLVSEPPYFSFANLFSNILFFLFYLAYFLYIYYKLNLFEEFNRNLIVKSYSQVKKYAISNVYISCFTAIWNTWMHYFGDTAISNPQNESWLYYDVLFLVTLVLVSVILLVVTNYYYFTIKKKNSDNIPCDYFLLKINLIQIIALLIEILIIIFNAFLIQY